MKTASKPTIEYTSLQKAYDFFNKNLFGNDLCNVLITLQRKANAKGYFSPERFVSRGDEDNSTHELALNPDVFIGRTDAEILSTLVHEMVHVWQHHCGEPPRKSYHDRQWASKMVEVGLMPSDTGEVGGKQTGQKMTHYIIDGGAFDAACKQLLAGGFALSWQSQNFGDGETASKKKTNSKVKYTCDSCGANAWGKPESLLICGACFDPEDFDPDDVPMMTAEASEPA